MTSTVNDTIPATTESGTTSTTSLVQWTGIPVLSPQGQPHGKNPGFEHQLDEKDARVLRRHGDKIAQICDGVNRTTTTAIIEVGAEFAAVQALLAGKGREGAFRPWYKSLGFCKTSVYRAIAAHEAFEKCPTVGHFSPQAVYLLSAESCPAAARAAAMRLAEQGKHVDHQRAKDIVAKYVSKTSTRSARRSDVESADKRVPKVTTEIKKLVHEPEVEKPSDEVAARTTSGGGADIVTAAAPPVSTDDLTTATVGPERQLGLAGLQTVVAALDDMGLYDEYREVLDRIRVALEGNAGQEEENEEKYKWTL